jgi:ribosome biogenesis GTPase
VASKKKKVRVALRKNSQKQKPRPQDLTRRLEDPGPRAAEAASGERVRAKGELSRYRTIIDHGGGPSGSGRDDASEDGAATRRDVDLENCSFGQVVRIHGLLSIVQTEAGRTCACHIRRLLKSLAIDGRSVVTVGDRVWFQEGGAAGAEGVIERVEPRRGVITRGYRNRRHIIAANVDQVLIVSALAEPGLKLPLIDRYLISAETGGVRPVIILNKADLVDPALYQWVIGLYTQIGYETILTSAVDGRGMDRLRELLSGGITAVTGQSGVGKSSLLNAVQPELNLRVKEVSDWTLKGKHTTTTAELIRLDSGGFVVDTPGLRQFELWGVDPAQIEGHFVEFRPYVPLCKFPDCSHTHERDCAVKDAVHWGQLHVGRYESYLKLYTREPLEGE